MSFKTYTLLLALFSACSEKAATVGPKVELVIDGAARTVTIDRRTPLPSLVDAPIAKWIELRAENSEGRWLEIPTPKETYPDGELVLFPDRGRVVLGVFVGEVQLSYLNPTARIRIETRAPDPRTTPTLVIVAGGRDHLLNADALAKLPPGPRHGWYLADVIGLAATPGTTARIIGDRELAVEITEHAILKANQRREYVLRVWDNEGRHPTSEVRRVTKIVVP